MTQNQLYYWNLVETKRANAAKETNLAQQLQETQRTNRINESIKQQQTDETRRSNRANEEISLRKQAQDRDIADRQIVSNEAIAAQKSKDSRYSTDVGAATSLNVANVQTASNEKINTAKNKTSVLTTKLTNKSQEKQTAAKNKSSEKQNALSNATSKSNTQSTNATNAAIATERNLSSEKQTKWNNATQQALKTMDNNFKRWFDTNSNEYKLSRKKLDIQQLSTESQIAVNNSLESLNNLKHLLTLSDKNKIDAEIKKINADIKQNEKKLKQSDRQFWKDTGKDLFNAVTNTLNNALKLSSLMGK